MQLKTTLQNCVMKLVDSVMAMIPRPVPTTQQAFHSRLISHRGEHDRMRGPILENTLVSFQRAFDMGAWGVEFDVRWTSDLTPIIHHDPCTSRVFGTAVQPRFVLSDTPFEVLRAQLPLIPSLEEALRVTGRSGHAMIEIKRPSGRAKLSLPMLDRLEKELKTFKPCEDFHLMSLDPNLLLQCEFVPRKALLPIAELNIYELSRLALAESLGGVTGQYAVFPTELVTRHHNSQQRVGTGFAASRSTLYRELNRNIDWIFTNDLKSRAIELRTLQNRTTLRSQQEE